MKKKISVIVPVYNVEKYINQCIESIIQQTYENLEIILIDDGSPDKCPKLCDEWKKKDHRIKVIHQFNRGLSAARNVGIENATGDYITFVDSDDFIDKDMYATMIRALEQEDADIVVCGRYIYDGLDNNQKLHCLNQKKLFNRECALIEMLSGKAIEEAVWDKIYKKEVISNIRFPVGEINEDIVVMPKFISNASKIIHIGQPMYFYRKTNMGISKSGYNEKKTVVKKHIDEVCKFVRYNFVGCERALKIFQARYAYSLLIDLSLDSEKISQYSDDYQYYLKLLKKNYSSVIASNCFDIKKKLCSLLIIMELYGPLWRLKNK